MKKTKYILGIIFNILFYPALIIHELSNLLVCLLLFRIPEYISIRFSLKNPIRGYINLKDSDSKNRFIFSLIALAPLFELVATYLLSLSYQGFQYLFLYQMITIQYSLPSAHDFNVVLESIKIERRFSDMLFINKVLYWLFPDYWDSIEAEMMEKYINSFDEN